MEIGTIIVRIQGDDTGRVDQQSGYIFATVREGVHKGHAYYKKSFSINPKEFRFATVEEQVWFKTYEIVNINQIIGREIKEESKKKIKDKRLLLLLG